LQHFKLGVFLYDIKYQQSHIIRIDTTLVSMPVNENQSGIIKNLVEFLPSRTNVIAVLSAYAYAL
jgi:hypothetical protein